MNKKTIVKKKPNTDETLSSKEACALAGVCRLTLRSWWRRGYLHPRKVTRARWLWPKAELETFLYGKEA